MKHSRQDVQSASRTMIVVAMLLLGDPQCAQQNAEGAVSNAPSECVLARDLLRELVQIDTTPDNGCTRASEMLAARLRSIRRHSPGDSGLPVFEAGSLRIDFAARKVMVAGQDVRLTATEYALLRVLAQNVGRVVTHRHLLRLVWGPTAEGQSQYLRVYMNHLRKRIEADPSQPKLIRTEPGIGYRMLEPE